MPRPWAALLAAAAAVAVAAAVFAAGRGSNATHASHDQARVAPTPAAGTGRAADVVASGPRPAPVVHRPPGWHRGTRVPLVIALHASGGTPASFEAKSGWDAVADANGFIVAYLGSAAPAWKSPSNVAYISAQIDRIRAHYNTDPTRVFVTGFSAGAYISYFVACRLSGKVTAVAAVSGGMLPQSCHIARPISVLTIFGTHDILPLSGSARFPAPASVAAQWRRRDGCRGGSRDSTVGPTAQKVWSCAAGTKVGFYVIRGGHHVYPGSEGLPAGDPDAQYNASRQVWSFFRGLRSPG